MTHILHNFAELRIKKKCLCNQRFLHSVFLIPSPLLGMRKRRHETIVFSTHAQSTRRNTHDKIGHWVRRDSKQFPRRQKRNRCFVGVKRIMAIVRIEWQQLLVIAGHYIVAGVTGSLDISNESSMMQQREPRGVVLLRRKDPEIRTT